MKEQVRKIIQYSLHKYSLKNNGVKVLFPHWNDFLSPIFKSVLKNNGQIYFLPLYSNEIFNWMDFSLNSIDDKFKKKFDMLVNYYIKYLRDHKIDYFVADRLNKDILDFKAQLIAINESNIKAIYLEHGHSGGYHPYTIHRYMANYDYFYALDNSMQDYIRRESKKQNQNIIVGGWEGEKLKIGKQDKNIIVYASTLMTNNRYEHLMPEPFGYQMKKEVIKWMNKYSGQYKMIYKTYSKGNDSYDPIPELIKNKYRNIKVVDNYKLTKLLYHVKYFITDVTSTPLYNAISMGVPSICLKYSKSIKVRDDIQDSWNKIIYYFSDIKEIEYWLDNWMSEVIYRAKPIDNTITKFPWEK